VLDWNVELNKRNLTKYEIEAGTRIIDYGRAVGGGAGGGGEGGGGVEEAEGGRRIL